MQFYQKNLSYIVTITQDSRISEDLHFKIERVLDTRPNFLQDYIPLRLMKPRKLFGFVISFDRIPLATNYKLYEMKSCPKHRIFPISQHTISHCLQMPMVCTITLSWGKHREKHTISKHQQNKSIYIQLVLGVVYNLSLIHI